jgi:hypothetical protein
MAGVRPLLAFVQREVTSLETLNINGKHQGKEGPTQYKSRAKVRVTTRMAP